MKIEFDTYYNEPMSYESAEDTMKSLGKGSVLTGLEKVQEMWSNHCNSSDIDSDDWIEEWRYELSAYNIMITTLAPIFELKK